MDTHPAPDEHDEVVPRSAHAPETHPSGPRAVAVTYVSGFLMGSADIVPGVSGGTVALVLGIYERLVASIRQGAHAMSLLVRGRVGATLDALRHVEWVFLLSLLAGIATAVVTLASGLEHLLETQPVPLSAAFLGLVAGSCVVALDELEERTARLWGVMAVSAVVTFVLLGFRTGSVSDPAPAVVFASGALAICAMILPGISGSFILLMIGMYQTVLGSITDRDLGVIVVFGAGAVIGLAAFSTVLTWMLVRARDLVLAVLIGLMAGSLRVLWPWPAGEDGVGDTTLGAPDGQVAIAVALAIAGFALVVLVARVARRIEASAIDGA
jgi:putative membrane protein